MRTRKISPDLSIEGMRKRLRLLCTPQVKRQARNKHL